jgi:hypothetical protein
MKRFAMILAVVILPAWVLPAPADGIFGFFGKKTKVNPAQRVPQLIVTLKTEQDERKRSSAAAELGTYDAATYTEIVPVLVDVLQHDPKTGVRMDAASSLGSIRPVSQLAGQALERAVAKDDNWRVRLHAKGILMKYRIAGYSPGKGDVVVPRTKEPPLLDSNAVFAPDTLPRGTPAPAQFPTGPATVTKASTTKSPAPRKDDTPEFRPAIPRPLPQGPSFTTAVPQQTVRQAPPPLPMVNPEGPQLTPLPPVPPRTATPAPPTPAPPAPPVFTPPAASPPPAVTPPLPAPF